MALQLPGNSKELPGGISLESLYQINNQSALFLIWILKQNRFWPDLNREVLETPFIVERAYHWKSVQMNSIKILKNKIYHNIVRTWHENGQLKSEGHWKDGKFHGIQNIWHRNGQPWWERSWKDGKKDGICRGLNENGQLWWEQHWKDGKEDGIEQCWYENGQLHWERHWKDGKKDSIQREWNLDGRLLRELHWKDGQKIYDTKYEKSLFQRKIDN